MKKIKQINASKLAFKVLLLEILITNLSCIAFAETNTFPISTNENTSTTLSIDKVKEIAAFSLVDLSTIPELSEWGNASVEPDITFYDLDGNVTAYAFNVMKDNQYDGYIIASATKDKYPILEFSKGKLPNKISAITKKSKNEVANYANKNKLNVGKSVPIYEGATFYYMTYDLQENKNMGKKKVIVDLVTSEIISKDAISEDAENVFFTSKDKIETIESDEIEEAWSDLESQMTEKAGKSEMESSKENGFSIQATGTLKTISGVPYYLANVRGCAPAAAAMVLGYWDTHGYPNLPSGNTLINELARAMWTNDGQSHPDMIDESIEKVCKKHGYKNFYGVFDTSLSKSEVTSEIDANRPFVLSMYDGGVGSGNSNRYGDHAVTCMGYKKMGSRVYVYIHDGWDTKIHYITFGNWDDVVATRVRT
ncbi:C39 family peptidase [Methanosarcina barkeri]|uniref:Peptidase C39 family n=1 Tax=Methanosarcina barkeri CM1 TaxID=796385 RepID=A0A0G3CFC2_METBA|nr:C39 family peptidase [Methanosarcina barkeri]AKJ39455.1 peptidase C39 family [Methanosarcina barkeri CM1]